MPEATSYVMDRKDGLRTSRGKIYIIAFMFAFALQIPKNNKKKAGLKTPVKSHKSSSKI